MKGRSNDRPFLFVIVRLEMGAYDLMFAVPNWSLEL